MKHCRACFKIINEKKACKLNDMVKNVVVALMLSECTGVLIGADVENEFICSLCKRLLITFYNFKQKARETEKKFEEIKILDDEPPVEVKVEEIKMEVDAWDDDTRESKPEVLAINEANENHVKSKKSKYIKVKNKSTHILSVRRRRHREPGRKENLMKYKRNDEGLYECPKENCPGLFKILGRLEMHLENKHSTTNQKIFPCESCPEQFPTLLLLKRHVIKLHTPRPYICDICGNNYAIFDSLRTHIYSHIEGKPKKEKAKCACPVCGKIYVSQANMLRHRKEVHFPKELIEKPYICAVCGSRWQSKNKLNAHMRIHAGLEYYCDICSKGFKIKGSLSLHMQMVHNTDRPFFCDICGKTYKTKYNLRDHQASHNEERSFKCSMCPAMFRVANTLHTHEVNVHTSLGPIACKVCNKLCKNKSSLKSHLLLHSGKDLQCPHCDKTYKLSDTLKRHIQRVHMGLKKRHECSVCLKNLWSRKHIADHIEEAHKDVIQSTGKTADELVRKYWTSDPSGANLGETPPKGIIGRPVCVKV